jgi:NADPH:quinone reductase-like Zn-dependent oxidoreductase
MRRGEPLWGRVMLGFFRPRKRMRVLGIELAGAIESVGASVTRFAPGDEVFGFASFNIGANATLDQIAEAHRYFDSGGKRGHVVVAVRPAESAA